MVIADVCPQRMRTRRAVLLISIHDIPILPLYNAFLYKKKAISPISIHLRTLHKNTRDGIRSDPSTLQLLLQL